MDTWFGTCSAPGVRMRARGGTAFHDIEGHEIQDGNAVYGGFMSHYGGGFNFCKSWVPVEKRGGLG